MKVKHLLFLIVALIFVFLGKHLFFKNNENPIRIESKKEPTNTPPTSTLVASSPNEENVDRKVKLENVALKKVDKIDWNKMIGVVRKSPACLTQPETHSLQLTPLEVFHVYRNHRSFSKSIIIDPFRFCLSEGSEVQIFDLENRGKIKIIGLELIQIDKKNLSPLSKIKVAARLDIRAWGKLVLDFFQSYDFSPISESYRIGMLVVFDFTEKKDFDWTVPGSKKAPLISGVRYINKANFERFASKAYVIDVRSIPEFESGALPHAVNLPYLIRKTEHLGELPNAINVQSNQWLYYSLPLDHTKPILIYGQDVFDPRPWAAYLNLMQLRYPFVAWVYDGYSKVLGMEADIIGLQDYPLAKEHLITAKEVLKMGSQNPRFVYVGTKKIEPPLFPGMISIPYFEVTKMSGKPTLDWVPALKKGGDIFEFEKKIPYKTDTVILTDYDDFSNRPLKAALWMQSEGYKNIYIYTNGLNNLLELRTAIPETVNCAILSSLSNCK